MNYAKTIYSAGIFLIALGVLVIAGWMANIQVFKSVIPGLTSMKFNTALCFIFGGCCLLSLRNTRRNYLTYIFAAPLIFIGALTLFEDISNANLSIDNIFSADHSENTRPGRMAPTTAFSFVVLGIAFFLIKINKLRGLAQGIFHFVSVLAFVSILGYFFQVRPLYDIASFAPMALHTSFAFLAVSVAASLFNHHLGITGIFTGEEVGNRMVRDLFPKLLFALLIITFIGLEAHRNQLVEVEFGIALHALSFIAVGLLAIWQSAKMLNKIDREREQAKNELIFTNQNLERIVGERTDELQTALDKLNQTNDLNRIFVNQSPNAIAMFDTQLRYIAASEKWINDYGLTGKEIIGVSHYDIFPEIGDDWKQIHQECLTGAINKCDEASFERQDGTLQWITWDVRPWYISKEEIGGLLMYTSDITAIKEKDQKRLRIEQILDKTNEIARIGTWEVDLKKQKINWSRITREIHEVEQDYEPQLDSAVNFFNGESKAVIQNAVEMAIAAGKSYDVEVELTTAKGNITWARAIGQAEFKDGVCQRLYGVFQDITEVKRSREAVSDLNEELKAILNAGYVSIIGTDVNGTITHFNKGAETLLQYKAEEMIGINTPALIHVEDEVIQRGDELSALHGRTIQGFDVFVEAAKQGEHESREWTYVRKDGTTFPVQLVVSAIKDGHGGTKGFLGIATDITDLEEAKTELEILSDRLQKQNKQLLNFAHITSHNLRSPVSNLNTVLYLHKESESDEEKEVLCGHMETVVKHLTETLDNLVDSLKVKENTGKERENLKFADIFAKTKEMFIGSILEYGAKVTGDFSEVTHIDYPRSYLESIMLNLLSNALKYKSPERVPQISFKTQAGKNGTVLTVSDNGLGIDLEKHGSKIFGLNKTFHRHAEAKGVGLFMTKIQIEAMGGSIEVKSEVDKGTTFTVNFTI